MKELKLNQLETLHENQLNENELQLLKGGNNEALASDESEQDAHHGGTVGCGCA